MVSPLFGQVTFIDSSTTIQDGDVYDTVVVYDPYENGSYLGLPKLKSTDLGLNTYRVVLYNHGGKGIQEGGDLSETVRKLAEVGFIAYAKKRRETSISATLTEVANGLDELLDLTPEMLQGRSIVSGANDPGVSIIGYSRGGLLALRIAELQATMKRPLVKIDKVIIQAAAPGEDLSDPGTSGQWVTGGANTFEDAVTMDEYLSDGWIGGGDNIGMINAATSEFFLLAANNDQPPDTPYINHVDLVTTVHNRLVNRGVTSSLKIYNDWIPPESGHQLFESVEDGGQYQLNQPGYYWHDVIFHLYGQPIPENTMLLSPAEILVSIVLHHEQSIPFHNNQSTFMHHRSILVDLAQMLHSHNVMFNYQPDWPFPLAVDSYDTHGSFDTNNKNVLRYLSEDLGFEIDPHCHTGQSSYNYADVAYLIEKNGVKPSGIVGGFIVDPPDISELEDFYNLMVGSVYPAYSWTPTATWGGSTSGHTDEESLWVSGIWKPRDRNNFLVHEETASLPNIGGYSTTHNLWSGLDRLIQLQKNGELQSGSIYTCSIAFSQGVLTEPGFVDNFEADLLARRGAPHLLWVGLGETLTIWENDFFSEANQLCHLDINRDGQFMNIADFSVLANQWLNSAVDITADVNIDQSVNILDLIILSKHWLKNIGG